MKPATNLIWPIICLLMAIYSTNLISAEDNRIIYSISHPVPMGIMNEQLHKNFFLNMGSQDGLKEGAVVNVFRLISEQDPYQSKKRYNHKVKVGELKILHAETNSAIALKQSFITADKGLLLEIEDFMIGDKIEVKVN